MISAGEWVPCRAMGLRFKSRVLGRVAVVTLLGGVLWTCTTLDRDPNERALGTKAPTIALVTSAGQPFSWDALGDRTPVFVFYRGRW